MTLRIGLSIDPSMPRFLDIARQAERIGVGSVWVADYWAHDAFTPLAAVAAVTERLRLATGIGQLAARTPAMLAMTAQGVQAVSDSRLILGIGTSGPQVMEGWHGVRFDCAVQRTRETIELLGMITAGERLAYDGTVSLELTNDDPAAIEAAGRHHADGYAFTFGAMGTASKNFYNDAFARQGFGDDVEAVCQLWAAGDLDAAAARVPIEIGFGTNLIGPPAVVKTAARRLRARRRHHVADQPQPTVRPFDRLIAELEILLDRVDQAGREFTDSTTRGAVP